MTWGLELLGRAGAAFGIYSTRARQASAGGQKGCNVPAEEAYMGKIMKSKLIPSAKADQNPQWPHKLYFHSWLPVGALLGTPCKQRIN